MFSSVLHQEPNSASITPVTEIKDTDSINSNEAASLLFRTKITYQCAAKQETRNRSPMNQNFMSAHNLALAIN